MGGLVGLGIPEIEAKRYEEKLKKGNYRSPRTPMKAKMLIGRRVVLGHAMSHEKWSCDDKLANHIEIQSQSTVSRKACRNSSKKIATTSRSLGKTMLC